MYTFCFVKASSSTEAERLSFNAVEAVRACLPSLGSPSRVESIVYPELGAAFATLKPEVDVSPSLIQHDATPDVAVLVSGSQPGTLDLASEVRRVYQSSGIDGIAGMEGNLSAVVIDRKERCVWVVGTLLGHRSLFYHGRADTFLVSPHDLTLLATQRVPLVFDPATLASMAACDWSLTGRSLLADVVRCHPLEAVRWQDDRLSKRLVAKPFDIDRIHVDDAAGIRRQVSRAVDCMMGFVENHVTGLERVRCSLTAGMDSRAVFAALCGARSGQALIASTSGGERSLDVVVARKIAALVDATHERQEPTPPATDDFVGSARLRAFFCSGDTNAKRSMSRLPRLDPEREWSAGGNGGEIYRGFFYQYFGVTGVAPQGVPELVDRLLGWRFRRLSRLPFAAPQFRASVRERLLEAVQLAEHCSTDPYDMVDLLYLFERYGRWGAAPAALPWHRGWTPFESIAAIREAFRLPAPIGKRCAVHAELVRRFLPSRAYWMPINGGQLLALEGNGRLRYALRQALNGGSLLLQRARRRLQKDARRGDDKKAEFLAGPLSELTRSLLLEQGSLSEMVFGREGVHQLLNPRHGDGLAVVGVLLTAEMWRRLATEMSQISADRPVLAARV
jgi:hypothetical protein